MKKIYICIYILFFAFSTAEASPRQDSLAGPVTGEILRVYDGDTVDAKIRVWIGQEIETSVRIDGIDAPEIKGKCAKERIQAEKARQELIRILNNEAVAIYNIRLEKYAGRVLAQVQTARGINVGQHMIEKGLARAYHGKARLPWCP